MKQAVRLLAGLALLSAAGLALADERIGSEILLAEEASYIIDPPRTASDGLGAFVVWASGSVTLQSARIDGAGTTTGPFTLASGWPHKRGADIASDGRNALVVWGEEDDRTGKIKALRIGPDGAALDVVPTTVGTLGISASSGIIDPRVAFDGTAYRVVWGRINSASDTAQLYTGRVGIDGALVAKPRRIRTRFMNVIPFSPRVACRGSTHCLVTWLETGATNRVVGARWIGDEMIDDTAIEILRGSAVYNPEVSTNGSDYFVAATGGSYANPDALGARLSAGGVALEVNGFRLNNPPPLGSAFVGGVGVTFDGTNYIASFMDGWSSCGSSLFAVRVDNAGQVLDADVPGVLISDAGAAYSTAVAATRTAAVVAWEDSRNGVSCGYPAKRVYAQRALAHGAPPGYADYDIGAIGPQAINEQAVLGFTVSAPALNPATTIFNAGNLPPGAVFDAATRTFRWKPAPNEAGVYGGVHFEASDGIQTVSEDVVITVAESSLSLCGVADSGGSPVPGVFIKLKGRGIPERVVSSDLNGRFCFFFLSPGQHMVKLARQSTRQYRGTRFEVVVGASDATIPQFSVHPR